MKNIEKRYLSSFRGFKEKSNRKSKSWHQQKTSTDSLCKYFIQIFPSLTTSKGGLGIITFNCKQRGFNEGLGWTIQKGQM